MMADFFKWSMLIYFSLIMIVLSALSYVHMAFPMILTILVFSFVYIKSLLNEYPFLNYDVSNIDINLNEDLL